MTDDQVLEEALRLTDAGDFAPALTLWEKLKGRTVDIQSKCLILLNERRCLSGLGEHDRARDLLRMVEEIDTSGEFCLYVASGYIDNLPRPQKREEAIKLGREFLQRNAKQLADPQFKLLAVEAKLSLGCDLVNATKFEEGIAVLSEILPFADPTERRRILSFRATAFQHSHQDGAAIDDLNQIVQAEEHDQWTADAFYDLGMIYQSREAFAWAKQNLQKAESLKDLLTVPLKYLYVGLANTCLSLREREEARRYKKLAEAEA